jgi:hypothetical protein
MLISLLSLLVTGLPVFAAPGGDLQVVVQPTQSLRDLSSQYLNDADAWPILLLYNGFKETDSVPPGTTLAVPATLFLALNQRLDRCTTLIGQANKAGAAKLAPVDIGEAIRLRDQAMYLKKTARLKEAAAVADKAISRAEAAFALADKGKNRSVEAWLAARSGTVQNRPPDATDWQETAVNQKLVEQERIRTLAGSRGKVDFKDNSYLILGEQSLAIIGSMKENVLRNSFNTRVTVVEGDIMFHLASLNQRKDFNVNTPNMEADIRSTAFRASRDRKNVTRLANYDGEIDVKALGSLVTVKKNQATKIPGASKPTVPKDLLPPPQITAPVPDLTLHAQTVDFTWQPVAEALQYRLQISHKPDFILLLDSRTVKGSSFAWKAPSRGVYFFRILTVDRDQQAGAFSQPLSFLVDVDELPPFLVLNYPGADMAVSDTAIEVQGEVEKGTVLRINGQPVTPEADGSFSYGLELDPARPVIRAEAADRAGNVSTVVRKLTIDRNGQLITFDSPPVRISNRVPVPVSGHLRPETTVEINGRKVNLAREFTYLLDLAEGKHAIQLIATGADGQKQELNWTVTVDLTAPVITLAALPLTTTTAEATIAGSLSEQVSLFMNNKEVPLEDLNFRQTVSLGEGENSFDLLARDRAGNQEVQTVRIFRDSRPPKIIKQTVKPARVKGGEIVRLQVRAEDSGVGLARIGSFTLRIGERRFKGILKECGKADNSFAGSVFIPPGINGKVDVDAIQLHDILGNETGNAPANL